MATGWASGWRRKVQVWAGQVSRPPHYPTGPSEGQETDGTGWLVCDCWKGNCISLPVREDGEVWEVGFGEQVAVLGDGS